MTESFGRVCVCGHGEERHDEHDRCLVHHGSRWCPCQEFEPQEEP